MYPIGSKGGLYYMYGLNAPETFGATTASPRLAT